jgi:hypothetical protein
MEKEEFDTSDSAVNKLDDDVCYVGNRAFREMGLGKVLKREGKEGETELEKAKREAALYGRNMDDEDKDSDYYNAQEGFVDGLAENP